MLWIIENETRLVQDRDLVCIFKFPTLVPADESFVDERTIAGQVFNNGGIPTILVLTEDNAMAV